jgi:hypothetical protein
MLKLNLQLRSEFMKYFHQQQILLSTPELDMLTTQLQYLELDEVDDHEGVEGNTNGKGHNNDNSPDELDLNSSGELGNITPTPSSDEISRSMTPTSLNDTSPSSSNYSTLSSIN